MPSSQPVWRQAVDVADRAVGPRLEQMVKTEEFAIAVGLLVRTRNEIQKRTERQTRRLLHLFNLPAGSDITRLMRQIGELERQIQELGKQLAAEKNEKNEKKEPSNGRGTRAVRAARPRPS
jgi:hypothetical protein